MSAPLLEISKVEWQTIADHLGWTEREKETAWLLFHDHKRTAIARHLHCSARTVRNFIDAVFKKAGVSDRGKFFLRIPYVWLELTSSSRKTRVAKAGESRRRKARKKKVEKKPPSRTKVR